MRRSEYVFIVRQRGVQNGRHLAPGGRAGEVGKFIGFEDACIQRVGHIGVPPVLARGLLKGVLVGAVGGADDGGQLHHLGQRQVGVGEEITLTVSGKQPQRGGIPDRALLLRAVPQAFVNIPVSGVGLIHGEVGQGALQDKAGFQGVVFRGWREGVLGDRANADAVHQHIVEPVSRVGVDIRGAALGLQKGETGGIIGDYIAAMVIQRDELPLCARGDICTCLRGERDIVWRGAELGIASW